MSMWTDRELKALIARVNDLEARVLRLETDTPYIPVQPLEPPDKRTKEWRKWKNANSSQS